MKSSYLKQVLAVVGVALAATSLSAQITGVSGSTAAPPAIFGGYTMTAFADDVRPNVNVNDVSSPLGGVVSFSAPTSHRSIGSGWSTWSHGYTGDVYYQTGTSLTLTLPSLTTAFYFYAEPQAFNIFNISALSGSVLLSESVNGSAGAEFFGFYTDGSVFLTSITITTSDTSGFAVGEFGIAQSAVPEPSTYALFGAALLVGVIARRRLKQSQKA
jgi:hypothetical protein